MIIALCGLAVAGIPFLTVMGAAAAVGVAVAVLVALTLLPAVLSLIGEHLRPKPTSHATKVLPPRGERRTFGARWVALITKVPAATVIVVLAAIGVLAYPMHGPRPRAARQRQLRRRHPAADHLRPGVEGVRARLQRPLLVTADVITSTDPAGTVDKLADDLASMDGVARGHQADPEPDRRTSAWSGSCPSGGRATRVPATWCRASARAPATWRSSSKVTDLLVTGQTAVAIDVSDRLGRRAGALRRR